ncbi:hypothetical protein MICAI_3070009 [Microcystis sp. T1-4]|nr:hypothetical protein MICAI_3070009 [Microcystis sp. T1-4]
MAGSSALATVTRAKESDKMKLTAINGDFGLFSLILLPAQTNPTLETCRTMISLINWNDNHYHFSEKPLLRLTFAKKVNLS